MKHDLMDIVRLSVKETLNSLLNKKANKLVEYSGCKYSNMSTG